MKDIEYNHSDSPHSLAGPRAALPMLFPEGLPQSILDVGCGKGTWLSAAINLGAKDVFGIDGIDIPKEKLHFSSEFFKVCDLTSPIDLNRRFDAVFCFEVAEHLDAEFAPILIQNLTKHSDHIYFSAACPDQFGQHHVNCQWPEYWQELFNNFGFICEDSLRWRILGVEEIEPWYRQNMIFARKDTNKAGKEPRISGIIHSKMYVSRSEVIGQVMPTIRTDQICQIRNGFMPAKWYFETTFLAFRSKIKRAFGKMLGLSR
jgi:SAM-dependent methyltransferase